MNIVEGHPFDCVLATSGIENTVKLFEPLLPVPHDLSHAQEVPLTHFTCLGLIFEGDGSKQSEGASAHAGDARAALAYAFPSPLRQRPRTPPWDIFCCLILYC